MDDARPIAAIFALTGFAVAVLSGLTTGGDASTTLTRALIVLPICFAIGLVAGYAIRAIAQEHMTDYQAGKPISGAKAIGAAQAERKS